MSVTLVESHNVIVASRDNIVIKQRPSMNDYAVVSTKVGFICSMYNRTNTVSTFVYRGNILTGDTKLAVQMIMDSIYDEMNIQNFEDAVDSFYNHINTRLHHKSRAYLKYVQDQIATNEYINLTCTTPYKYPNVNTYVEFKNEQADKIVRITDLDEIITNMPEFSFDDAKDNEVIFNYYSKVNSDILYLLERLKFHLQYASAANAAVADPTETHDYQNLEFVDIMEVLYNERQQIGDSVLLERAINTAPTTLMSVVYCDLPDVLDVECHAFMYENKCSQQLFREILCRKFKAERYTTKIPEPVYSSKYGEDRRLYVVKEYISGEEYYMTYRLDYYTTGEYDPQNKIIIVQLTKGAPSVLENYIPLLPENSNTRY